MKEEHETKEQKGFPVTELIILAVIIACFAAIIVPSLRNSPPIAETDTTEQADAEEAVAQAQEEQAAVPDSGRRTREEIEKLLHTIGTVRTDGSQDTDLLISTIKEASDLEKREARHELSIIGNHLWLAFVAGLGIWGLILVVRYWDCSTREEEQLILSIGILATAWLIMVLADQILPKDPIVVGIIVGACSMLTCFALVRIFINWLKGEVGNIIGMIIRRRTVYAYIWPVILVCLLSFALIVTLGKEGIRLCEYSMDRYAQEQQVGFERGWRAYTMQAELSKLIEAARDAKTESLSAASSCEHAAALEPGEEGVR